MTKSDIYEIAIKILGLYLVTIVIVQMREVITYATILTQVQDNPDIIRSFNQTYILIVTLCSFLVLIAFTDRNSNCFCRSGSKSYRFNKTRRP